MAMGWGVAVSGQGSGADGTGVAGLTLRMRGLRSMLSRTTPSRSFSVPGPASAKVSGHRRDPALRAPALAMAQGGRARSGDLSAVPVLLLLPGEGLGGPGADAGALSAVPVPVPIPGVSARPRCRCRGSPTELAARPAASVSRQRAVRRSDGSGWGLFRRGNGWAGAGRGGGRRRGRTPRGGSGRPGGVGRAAGLGVREESGFLTPRSAGSLPR